MTEVERSWRRTPESHSGSNGQMLMGNASPVKRRARSNSKSNGGKMSEEMEEGHKQKLQEKRLEQPLELDTFRPAVAPRNKYTHIIILKSLNETFETKFLVVPFKPESFKLGRPVVNSNASSQNYAGAGGNIGKQDPQQVPQVRPDNGHFDSRVLSRNHASLSCDPATGKIYIRDLKSSNGTFVNGDRIDQNDVELKVGDVIDLGTDIDSKFEHRKISAYVEDISVIPLINETAQTGNSLFDSSSGKDAYATGPPSGSTGQEYMSGSSTTAQRAAFEAAMFGDVNNLDLEDTVLGSETEILSGIFINNSIGTSPNLINVIKALATEISLEKHEYAKLKSMESFLINYTTNLEYVNKLMVEKNDKQLVKLQSALRQKMSEKQSHIMKEHKLQLDTVLREKNDMQRAFDIEATKSEEHIKELQNDLEDLRTRLEVEKYRNAQLSKSIIEQDQRDEPAQNTQNGTKLKENRAASAGKGVDSEHRRLGGGSLLLVSVISVGFIAYAMTLSSENHA
ncbi:hypothetical protein HG536_0C00470 [Torulaspora globosa]|uniref:FHA domain-containing protein n=1 Tax=Torulaspora globosa TaxID=48254 RepID=A0A7G3ZEE4_9SACH|nr:uncharacterized protein HG536_0C00470 [Torulaspora globosa]QLL31880.1 hypothetical protein HG536_0C00470 [Torulaspora globosa]